MKPQKRPAMNRMIFARVTPEERDNALAHAEKHNVTMTDLVRSAMDPYLSKPPRGKR